MSGMEARYFRGPDAVHVQARSTDVQALIAAIRAVVAGGAPCRLPLAIAEHGDVEYEEHRRLDTVTVRLAPPSTALRFAVEDDTLVIEGGEQSLAELARSLGYVDESYAFDRPGTQLHVDAQSWSDVLDAGSIACSFEALG